MITGERTEEGIFDLKWNNFANYKIMLQNNQIFTYFKNTFVFVALVVVIQLVLGMGIALLLDSKIKARGTLRGLMLVPWTIPSVVTAIVWRFMTNSSYGVINWIAYKLGMIPTLDYSWTLQSGSAHGTDRHCGRVAPASLHDGHDPCRFAVC